MLKKKYRKKSDQEQQQPRSKIRKILNIEERAQAIKLYDRSPVYRYVAEEFNCSWVQIKRVVQNRDKILAYYARCQIVDASDDESMARQKKINFLSKIMFEYVNRTNYHKAGIIDDESIRNQALRFRDDLCIPNFYPNNAWVNDFKLAYKLDYQQLDLLVTEAPPESLNNKDIIAYCIKELEQFLKPSKNSVEDVTGTNFKSDGVGGKVRSGRSSLDLMAALVDIGMGIQDDVMSNRYGEGDQAQFYKNDHADDDDDDNGSVDDVYGDVGDNVIDLSDADDDINENEEGPTIYYGDMEEAASAESMVNLTKTGSQSRQAPLQKPYQSPQKSQIQPSKPVTSTVHTHRLELNQTAASQSEASHATNSAKLSSNSKQHRIEGYEEALDVLRPLEEFALLQEDFRAVNVLSQLVAVYRIGLKRKQSSSRT